MVRGVLLWTERPVRLEREEETRAWMEWNEPWAEFDLELIFDNSPGKWMAYDRAFRRAWRRARELSVPLLNLESDIVPTHEAFRALLGCPEPFCMAPYEVRVYDHPDRPNGYSAMCQRRVKASELYPTSPAGWLTRPAEPGDEWAEEGDLAFLKIGPGLMGRFNIEEVPPLEGGDEMLNMRFFETVRKRFRYERPLHLHWPALRNNHLYIDEGTPGFVKAVA